jgi:uncharacterized protein
VAGGAVVDRPAPADAESSEKQSEWQARVEELVARLTADIPVDVDECSAEQQARWILAHTLDWHRREEKTLWWEYFRLSGLSSEDLFDERAALSGLAFAGKVGGSAKAPVHRYGFPAQETELRGGESLHRTGGEKLGTVERISLDERVIEIKKRGDSANVHPDAVFAHNVINTAVLAEALMRIGGRVADEGIAGDGQYGAARSLLLRESPRLNGEPLYVSGETMLAAAMRIAPKFQGGVLPIQGPPGTGKTHVGARMIACLAGSGKTIGITATSHKVIRRLLDEVVEAGEELGVSLRCIQKTGDGEDGDAITCTDSNEENIRSVR